MKHIITIAAVNFPACWGNKTQNRQRIMEYIECAAKRGADLILFPETALSGYDGDGTDAPLEARMHRINAETTGGETVGRISELTRRLGVYAIFGMPERDAQDETRVYNAAVVCGPEGFLMSYRKRNLPNDESTWAVPGRSPIIFDSPWGPIGVGICADVYDFPEYMRYARAKGARLFLNATAVPSCMTPVYPKTALEMLAGSCAIFIASADLCGPDRVNLMSGGSSILGPASQPPSNRQGVHYYAGKPFGAADAIESELVLETIDLSLCERSYMHRLWNVEDPQWDPEEFIGLYRELGQARK